MKVGKRIMCNSCPFVCTSFFLCPDCIQCGIKGFYQENVAQARVSWRRA